MSFGNGEGNLPGIDSVLGQAVDSGDVPGVVAAVTDGATTVYAGAAGRAGGQLPMATDTVFRIASMTKLVTTIAVMMLVEEGKLELDKPLVSYLPNYSQPDLLEHFDYPTATYSTRALSEHITIRQLLTHTSGYGYWFLDRRLKMLTTGEPELFDPPFLIAQPGARFNYSASTDVLGQVVHPVSGLTLSTFFKQRIFDPLGMNDTSYLLPDNTIRLASVFVRSGTEFSEQTIETETPRPRGGGGLYSTAGDYLSLLRMLLNKGAHNGRQILAPETVGAMTTNQIGELFAERETTAFLSRTNDFIFMDGTQKFGFGVTVETEDKPTGRRKGSYGWAGILNTYFWVDPVSEIAGTIMMQLRPFAVEACVDVYRRFERSVYDSISAGR